MHMWYIALQVMQLRISSRNPGVRTPWDRGPPRLKQYYKQSIIEYHVVNRCVTLKLMVTCGNYYVTKMCKTIQFRGVKLLPIGMTM